jgi:hypothetical protein
MSSCWYILSSVVSLILTREVWLADGIQARRFVRKVKASRTGFPSVHPGQSCKERLDFSLDTCYVTFQSISRKRCDSPWLHSLPTRHWNPSKTWTDGRRYLQRSRVIGEKLRSMELVLDWCDLVFKKGSFVRISTKCHRVTFRRQLCRVPFLPGSRQQSKKTLFVLIPKHLVFDNLRGNKFSGIRPTCRPHRYGTKESFVRSHCCGPTILCRTFLVHLSGWLRTESRFSVHFIRLLRG